ncbi:hypothetical protein GALMADRAFT_213274 [Galerina marginata CBS 339.88]|uniref:Uncharacterized protein n=1 Tax=Galerina marginata (strain CBS 339.88) TaxID=685588 RepID=A0A067SQB0_GALM3|nr:hypothetical protein GALMADRAFT_213274 [Galerina marginata CBS 339.88]
MTGLTSVDSLPNELLENIFKIGAYLPMPLEENYPHRPLFSKLPLSTLYPTTLSQVCIRWRETVLQMPVLWSFLHLSRTLESHRRLRSNIGRSLEWLPTYLIRSANLPLHVTLDTTRLPAAAAIHLLGPHSTRWRSFTLLVSHVGSLPAVLPFLVSPRVPKLKTLAIASDIYREGIVCYDPLIPFFVTSTPQLSTIHLNGVYVAWNELPLANLLNLELHFTSRWPNFAQLNEMFCASPMLQRLVIRDEVATLLRHVDQPPSKPTIELCTLKHLEIDVHRIRDEPADVVGLIGLFSMPALETLTLKGLRQEEWTGVRQKYHLPLDSRCLPFQPDPSMVPNRRQSNRPVYQRLAQSFPFLSSVHLTFANSPRKSVFQPEIKDTNFIWPNSDGAERNENHRKIRCRQKRKKEAGLVFHFPFSLSSFRGLEDFLDASFPSIVPVCCQPQACLRRHIYAAVHSELYFMYNPHVLVRKKKHWRLDEFFRKRGSVALHECGSVARNGEAAPHCS